MIDESKLSNIVSYLCKSCGVSRSGYYNYLSTEDRRLEREKNDLIDKEISLTAFNYRGYKKGSRSIKLRLDACSDVSFSRKKIVRLIKKYNIICPIKKKDPHYKLIQEHKFVPNRVNREFKKGEPG